jgi:hypothetical protein
MKKLLPFLLVCAIAVLTGCATTFKHVDLGVYDASVPREKQCELRINGAIAITEFDGKKVKWYRGIRAANKAFHVEIPAGDHTITGFVHMYQWVGKQTQRLDFKAGHLYMINPTNDARWVISEIKKTE